MFYAKVNNIVIAIGQNGGKSGMSAQENLELGRTFYLISFMMDSDLSNKYRLQKLKIFQENKFVNSSFFI